MSTATALAKEVTTAKVGQPAPDFDLPSTKNMETLAENVKLVRLRGQMVNLAFLSARFYVRLSDGIDGFF
jgi:hypothetical protein